MDCLDSSLSVKDISLPGFNLHKLSGKEKEIWSIIVNGNWRITFYFKDGDAYIVNYLDYSLGENIMRVMRKPTHPGNILKEEVIAPLGLSVT